MLKNDKHQNANQNRINLRLKLGEWKQRRHNKREIKIERQL